MKKALWAAVCCMSLGLSNVFAQNDMPQGGRHMRGGMRGGMEMVADTAITNHMELSIEQAKAIEEINTTYRAKIQSLIMPQNEDNKPANREEGRRMRREGRDVRMQQINAEKKEARQQLRAVLGDELYIQYLEESIDRRPMMMGGPRGGHGVGGGQRGGQRGGHRGGGFGGGFDGGFDGNDF